MIHSIGVYEKHTRITVEEFEKTQNSQKQNVRGEIEINSEISKNEPLSTEAQDFVAAHEKKHDFLLSKSKECDLVLDNYKLKVTEIENNYDASKDNVARNMKFVRQMIENKEKQLLAELDVFKAERHNELDSQMKSIKETKVKINHV